MDSDDRIVGEIFTRRQALSAAGKAGLGVLLGPAVALGQAPKPAVHLVVTPEVEEGPFFIDERLNRSDITAGTDRPTVVHGTPLALEIVVYRLSGATHQPQRGATIDLWHADASGHYSDESGEGTEGQKWLRGYQTTDGSGRARFKTIYPGWYPGRTPHIHLKLRTRDSEGPKQFTTQLFFDEATNDEVYGKEPYNSRGSRHVRNEDDSLYSVRQADGSKVGSHLHLSISREAKGGYVGRFTVAVSS